MKRVVLLVLLFACEPPARGPDVVAVASASAPALSVSAAPASPPTSAKKTTGALLLRLSTPGASVELVCECKTPRRKQVPSFPIRLEFGVPTDEWVLHATKPGFEELVVPITFDEDEAERVIDVTLTKR